MASLHTSATTSAADAAHAAAASSLAMSQIKPGALLPDVLVKENNPQETFSLAHLPGKNIIVGVPGAFTPSCSSHIPGYISDYEKFRAKGVHGIYVVAVNDAFVTKAWKDKLAGGDTPVHFIADDKGAFTAALGLIFDASPLLGGLRAKRYVLVVDNGKVTSVHVEEHPPDIKETAAEKILSVL